MSFRKRIKSIRFGTTNSAATCRYKIVLQPDILLIKGICKLSLLLEMLENHPRRLQADKRREMFDRRLRDFFERAEVPQKFHLAFFGDIANRRDLRREIAFLAALAVKFDGGFVRFVADLPDESESGNAVFKKDRRVFIAEAQQMRDTLEKGIPIEMPFRRSLLNPKVILVSFVEIYKIKRPPRKV